MLAAPCCQAGFGDDFVERGGIVEHLFDVPGRKAQRIVAIREIAFRQQAFFQIRIGLDS